MSNVSKKNKAPKADEPKVDDVPVEEFDDGFVEETESVETVPKAKGRGKSDAPADSKKKKTRGGFRLSSIDPIILGSFMVFLIASLVVVGVTVYGIVAGDSSDQTAEYGDKVLVDYTGSYFAYYDENGAMIFDTSMSNVGDSDDYKKSYEYTAKTSYSKYSVTIGSGGSLAAFEDALIGLKPGQEARVIIKDGYGSLTQDVDMFTVAKSNGYSIPKVVNLSADDYKTLFETTSVPSGLETGVKSPYGWEADVIGNTDGTVTVDFSPYVEVKEYTENGVTVNVTSITGANISFEYKTDSFDRDANMLKTVFDGKIVYVIGATETEMTYKTTAENVGTTMYFYIKLVEFSS